MVNTLQPIDPDDYNWQKYNRVLHGIVLAPLFFEINNRISKAAQDYKSLRRAIRDIPNHPSMVGLSGAAARTQAAYIKRKHTRQYELSMRRYFGVRYRITDNARVESLMEKFIRDNVSLIKTIPPRLHAGLEKELIKLSKTDTFNQQKVKEMLARQYGSSGYNLRRLTRDQTSKAVGNLTQIRQEDSGIREYYWRTSQDERVRSSHRVLNGRRFRWSAPPPIGHPGHPIQCRCHAEGIIPPIRQMNKLNKRR